ncbi:MAG: AraC family transcriptional regulator [Bacteroidota bacterium]
MHLPDHFYQRRKLETLVEHKTTFTAEASELNIYETHEQASKVSLTFDTPVLTSMLTGKKVMHLNGMQPFDYLRGESVLMPAGEEMVIDFPEATNDNPTRCLALTISPELITKTVSIANDTLVRAQEEGEWQLTKENFYFMNDRSVHGLLQRLIDLFTEGNQASDLFVELSLKELLVRLMQTHARHLLFNQVETMATRYRMAAVVKHVRSHLDQPLSVGELASVACMSESHFHRAFKDTFGITPTLFVLNERLKRAKALLQTTNLSVSQIALECGFTRQNYFSKCFRKATGRTPSAFRKKG